MSATPQPQYCLSAELCHLIGAPEGTSASTDQLVQLLLDANALSVSEAVVDLNMNRWQRALRPALAFRKSQGRDSWSKYEIHHRPTELAIRWDYTIRDDTTGKGVWESSETLIKMEGTSFAKGAMRECYRMKKMSQVSAAFFYKANWQECNNYVAKRYLVEGTERETYFSDIEMQMVSKRFARKYNALKPPKKVDFLQAFVIEVVRNGEPLLFCVERAIESGQYTKHNNNSGFVEIGDDEKGASDGLTAGDHYRATPNAFTRFTFDASAGTNMIVDIQGVDDVYTDPQIHTIGGTEYGDGNLSVGGMALFFSTSQFDPLCCSLGLPDFSLSKSERIRIEKRHLSGRRSNNDDLDDSTAGITKKKMECDEMEKKACNQVLVRRQSLKANTISENEIAISSLPLELLQDDEAGVAARKAGGLPAACVKGAPPPAATDVVQAPIGLVHCKLVDYNLSGALPLLEDKPDIASAGFHLVCACAANEPRALRDLRSLARGLASDELLPGVRLEAGDELDALASWLVPVLTARLALSGDATAMLETANALAAVEGGEVRAAEWVQAAIHAAASAPPSQQTELALGGCAAHQLYERLAELQLAAGDEAKAGESYAAAAEAAMEAGKAKAAMKLQMLAEQYAVEDDADRRVEL